MRFIFSIVVIVAFLFPSTFSARAADIGSVTFSTYLQNPIWAKRFASLFAHTARPDWLKNATESPAASVIMDGKPFTVLQICQQHDCADHQMAILFDKKDIYAVQLVSKENSNKEELIWYNIGGGVESIDGKTILYAALTGSLTNHLTLFRQSLDQ